MTTLDTPQAMRERLTASGSTRWFDLEELKDASVERYSNGHARYGRKDGRPNALIASAARIKLDDRRAIENVRRRRQAWQSEAWDYYDEVGEIGYAANYIANLMSKLRLYPAVRPDPHEAPLAVDSEDAQKTVKGLTPEIGDLAIATLGRLKSVQGGQAAIVRELSLNFEITGEAYLHGHPQDLDDTNLDDTSANPPADDPNVVEDWQIRSVDELVIVGDGFALRKGPSITSPQAIPDTDLVIRLWERHPRYSEMATCAMRRCLAEAEALLLLSRSVRASTKSRLNNGILLVPEELSFGPIDPTRDGGDGEESDDPFDKELQDALVTAIQEEGAASAVAPITIRGPAEHLQHVNHLALDRGMDPLTETLIEQRILRIARALNLPVEIVTGMMATTFANAIQIRRSVFEDHIEPRAILICDAITSAYFQWALEEAGVDPEIARQIFVWFDPADVILQPDQGEQAGQAHRDMLISDAAYRRYLGFTEEDAPDDDEKLVRLLLNAPRMDPTLSGQILERSGLFPNLRIPAPAAGVLGDTSPESGLPAPGAPPPTAAPEAPTTAPKPPNGNRAAPIAAAGAQAEWATLGRTLAGIDRTLRTRMTGALDQAMRQALEKAGNRIKARVQRDKGGEPSALRRVVDGTPSHQVAARLGKDAVATTGLSNQELLEGVFNGVLADIATWMRAAYRSGVKAVEKAGGKIPEATAHAAQQTHDENVAKAVEWLSHNLHALASARLYSPNPGTPDPAGEHDDTVLIPASLVRAACAVAGGQIPKGGTAVTVTGGAWLQIGGDDVVSDGDGGPVGGIGTGPTMMGLVESLGGHQEAYQWEYGEGMRSEFQPHLDLDQMVEEEPDQFQWPDSYDGYPENDTPFPGDHPGCVCDLTPILVGPTGEVSTETPDDYDALNQQAADLTDTATDDEVQAAIDLAANPDSADQTAEAYVASTANPTDFADAAGFERTGGQVTDDDLKAAKDTLNDARQEIRDAAAAIADQHEAFLETAEARTMRYLAKGDADAEWIRDDIKGQELNRLRTNGWFAKPGDHNASPYDEILANLAKATNAADEGRGQIGEEQMLQTWLRETRVIDAARALANGKLINPDYYGGLDINNLVTSKYDLTTLFARKDIAIPYLAEQNAFMADDDAALIFGRLGTTHGPAPYEMTEEQFIAEATSLETKAAEIVPVSEGDEWTGPVYSTADQKTLDRLAELLPPALDDGTLSFSALYREIIKVARAGGLV